jgi:Bacterial Ig-like domain
MRSIGKACGWVATLLLLGLGTACSDPELASELDSEGPPEMVQVNVASETAPTDPNGVHLEAATFCRPGEQFVVSTFYCPLEPDSENKPIPGDRELEGPIMDAIPVGWHARFIFSELLDPDIEDLVTENGVTIGTIRNTQPATLRCNDADVEYDGWYDPTGNQLSYPPGPSLVVNTLEFIATGSLCEVSFDESVVDKDGNAAPENHRGPYEFGIAPLSITESVPENEAEGVALDAVVEVDFNAPIALATVTGTTERIVVTDEADTVVAGTIALKTDPDSGEESTDIVVFTPTAALAAGTTYTVTVIDDIADTAGGLLAQAEPFTASFTTAE